MITGGEGLAGTCCGVEVNSQVNVDDYVRDTDSQVKIDAQVINRDSQVKIDAQ